MPNKQSINLKAVEKVALALEELNEEVIYIGGAIVSLYVTDIGAEEPRPTKDIDVSVQISTYPQMVQLSEKLASKHIHPAPTEEVLYRYQYEDILIDFIPYDETPLGPTNSWLKPGFEKAYPVPIGAVQIRILPVSLFIATKWEAHKDRGGDPRVSHDFEDIIYVIDNSLGFVEDVLHADEKVKAFLKGMASDILSNSNRDEIIECHINPYDTSERRKLIIEKLEAIRNL